jgi:hypothetical protein
MAVSKKTRFEIFKRDGFACQYCGKKPPDSLLECDHVQPLCEGGSDEYHNLITSCFDCNRGKGGVNLGASDCDRVQEMQLEKIAQLAAFNKMLIQSEKARKNQLAWLNEQVATNLDWAELNGFEEKSIVTFSKRMDFSEIIHASEIAGGKRIRGDAARWRYFCGVCWSMIREKEGSDDQE